MQIEIWSDIVCPWCYLGKRHLEQALERVPFRDEVTVVYRSFELDPSAPHGVVTPTVDSLASKYGMTRAQAEQAQRQMEQRAQTVGLTFRMEGLDSGNTRDAHRLIHLAARHGVQAEVVEALHRAYFTEQRSIFDVDSLVAVVAAAGLDEAAARGVLAGDEFTEDVVADEELAHEFGASGVPFFVFDRRYAVSGAQPADTLVEVLHRAHESAA